MTNAAGARQAAVASNREDCPDDYCGRNGAKVNHCDLKNAILEHDHPPLAKISLLPPALVQNREPELIGIKRGRERAKPLAWSRAFDDPIALPDGRVPSTHYAAASRNEIRCGRKRQMTASGKSGRASEVQGMPARPRSPPAIFERSRPAESAQAGMPFS